MAGDVVGGRMGLPRAEGVVHIDVGQAGKLEREALPELALCLFALEPPRIRKVDPADLPFPQVPHRKVDGRVDPGDALHRIMGKGGNIELRVQLLLEIADHRFNGFLGPAGDGAGLFVLGPAHMGHQDGPAAPFYDMKKRADGAVDAKGVAYGPVLHDIMIEPHEDDLALQVHILDQRKITV